MIIKNLIVDLSPKEHKRLFAKIEFTKDGCWVWTGGKDHMGYGQGYYRHRRERVHRIMYAFFDGPIPRGEDRKNAQLDHLCKNRACCNPTHLELVTQRINILRGDSVVAKRARQTVCKYGHPFRPQNRGGRYCPTCDNLRHKKRIQGPQREYWLKKQREATERYRSK